MVEPAETPLHPSVEPVETPAAKAGRWMYVDLRARSGRRGWKNEGEWSPSDTISDASSPLRGGR